ncbi:MAG: hypothetical protein PHZ24_08975 [Bacteroidales bacterium]|nr:hypothetical protein [Bacteroidales bacterium]
MENEAKNELQIAIELAKKELEEKLIKRFGEKLHEHKKMFAPRKLSVIEVEDKLALLRPIGATEVGEFSLLIVNESLEKASRYLLEELWLDGDQELKNDEEYFIAAMMSLQKVVEVKKSSFFQL